MSALLSWVAAADAAGTSPTAARGRRAASEGRAPEAPRVLAFDKLDEWATLLAQIDAACEAQGVSAGAATAEYGGAQFEVNLGHLDDPVLACDHAMMLRRIVKGVAARHGLEATFMSKPFADQSGSGLHVHASLVDDQGQNVFDETTPDGDRLLGHAIAGLQATTYDAMAFFAPNINAFRRFAANQFVPVNTSWGINNRSVSFRVPMGGGRARRIEHRIAGADANPYLVMAAMLAGFHHGLANKLTPTQPSTGNAGEEADPDMPLRLWSALDRLEGSSLMATYFGPWYLSAYAAIKRSEFEAFQHPEVSLQVRGRFVAAYLATADRDGDGALNVTEFLADALRIKGAGRQQVERTSI